MDVVDEMLPYAATRALRRRREDIVTLSQRCHEAVLTPKSPGSISSEERIALAGRMARATGVPATIRFYDALVVSNVTTPELRDVAAGKPVATPRLAALATHVDLVTVTPGQSNRGAIDKLEQAGFAAADIVALAELIAVMNYQFRVVAGLELLSEVAA